MSMFPRDDALAIWQAGVDAVDSARLVSGAVRIADRSLCIADHAVPLSSGTHLEVVGGGKAGTGMARGLLQSLTDLPDDVSVSGWLNVPADCVAPLAGIHLHAARPAGSNEPTAEGVAGTEEILRRVGRLKPTDVCIVLISGGGSALLPAPVEAVTLADKLAVTRLLAAQGTAIGDLNIVRSHLSRIKGGGLLKHTACQHVIALIISDVIGDPLDIIASGPTTPASSTRSDALRILRDRDVLNHCPPSVLTWLQRPETHTPSPITTAKNFVIGSNRTALEAAAEEARRRAYRVISLGSDNAGPAAEHGRRLFRALHDIRRAADSASSKTCLLAGGETTVQLAETNQARRGGRNQEVVLAAIEAFRDADQWKDLVLLSGGTDGEDGPTDAAGAFADSQIVQLMHHRGIDPTGFLAINNSYPFFESLNGLLITGPTHTNVMDLAVGLHCPARVFSEKSTP
ncbi:MAG: DUF4147 domain-containing protein [Planctomycetaceae bacterium]